MQVITKTKVPLLVLKLKKTESYITTARFNIFIYVNMSANFIYEA